MKYILKNENEKDYNYSIIIKHSVREGGGNGSKISDITLRDTKEENEIFRK